MQILNLTIGRRPRCLVIAAALTGLLAATACGSAAEPTPAAPGATAISMAITGRASNLSRADLRVAQGDNVSITFTADEPGEIHLHGYDLTADVAPNSPGMLTFAADTAGAFGLNFHVFGDESAAQDATADGDHHHGSEVPDTVVAEAPVSLSVVAEADAAGGIDVHVETVGFRFAPEQVDQAHVPGVGHAHIYMDGEKLGRVFEPDYRIEVAPAGEREIRVSLNTNDHSELVFDGKKIEATVTVYVPDVGQGAGDRASDVGHDHGDRAIVAEVHLGNLEVYP